MSEQPVRKFQCVNCGHCWEVPFGGGRQIVCPKCGSMSIHRTNPGIRPSGRRGRWRKRMGQQNETD